MAEKKRKKRFFTFPKLTNSNEAEQESLQLEFVNDSKGTKAIPKAFIFDQIKTILLKYRVELLEGEHRNGDHIVCPECGETPHRLENMIILSDSQGNCYGLNGYYCSSCYVFFIDEGELSEVQDQISDNAVKITVLSNYERHLKSDGIEILPQREATMRGLLDKMNAVEENNNYRIVKANTLPRQCPVCDRAFAYLDDAVTMYRNDDAED